jgi:hypothetical protein
VPDSRQPFDKPPTVPTQQIAQITSGGQCDFVKLERLWLSAIWVAICLSVMVACGAVFADATLFTGGVAFLAAGAGFFTGAAAFLAAEAAFLVTGAGFCAVGLTNSFPNAVVERCSERGCLGLRP